MTNLVEIRDLEGRGEDRFRPIVEIIKGVSFECAKARSSR